MLVVSAFCPTAVLLSPTKLLNKAAFPTAVLSTPLLVFLFNAATPKAVLFVFATEEELFCPAPIPKLVLEVTGFNSPDHKLATLNLSAELSVVPKNL